MRIQLRFFAALREALDTETEALDLPPEVTDIGKLRCFLASAALHDGAEVAFFPPVTGG
ncbi:MAG: MoaD/ThiS family protein [Betaproteobacteria bacterium]|nr:MoaD/ThiS family protein [Betaproteobacteria bacterium]